MMQSFQPVAAPVVYSLDVRLDVETAAAGWRAALDRMPRIATMAGLPVAVAPGVVSIPLVATTVRTTGFTFAEAATGDGFFRQGGAKPQAAEKRSSGVDDQPRKYTRLKPPRDIIKLEDRLYYLLQPPLEALMASGELGFPFEPFPYQWDGIAFLYPRTHALLADEMGLGKTMQAITAIRLLLFRGEVRRVLLVCPKPLVTNWQREFATWAPEIPLTVIGGDQACRNWHWQHPESVVTIANYELLLRDRDVVADRSLGFDLVVLDEAQRIKNRGGATSEAVRSVARRRQWALTGTPMENSTEDLVGIFEFLSPGQVRSGMKPSAIRQAVRDDVLRRTKDQVLGELPPKLFRDATMDLSPEQQHTYQQAEDDGVIRLSDLGEQLTIRHVFELVLRLKQICNFDPVTGASTKLDRLEADLEECAASGRKAIVFSQWVETLTTLRDRLGRFRPLEYHGRIPSRQRDGVIEEFRNEPGRHVLLMSYGAGSVGLNLQFAGYVFLFDRWWNPAVEDQAINRAHRIGAAGPVTVTRFLIENTIEQRIDEILSQKREMFDTIFNDDATPSQIGMTRDEIFGLFRLETRRSLERAA